MMDSISSNSPALNAGLRVTVGVVTGYKFAPVMPLIAPSLVIDLTPATALRMTYIPKMQSDGARAINFAIQHSFH